ncbi:MAG TPA: hypothetical protein PLZ64_07955 [Chitinophagales bacterium]|nr:hypothetical protein [Chitinophagales bacterium]
MRFAVKFSFLLLICIIHKPLTAQDIIDVVDPFEMKVSRSAKADTFYFTQKNNPNQTITPKKLDTLRTYDVYLEERPTPFGKAYMCNGAEVTKQKYLEYKRFWDAVGACQPCLLYTFNDKDELKHVAFQYEECLCGSYKEYYAEGTLKIEGQFKQNPFSTWEDIKRKGVCNIRDGKWTYYTEEGAVLKEETYLNGKIINSSSGTLNLNSSSNQNTNTSTSSEKQGIRKIFSKKKNTIPTEEN